MAVAGGHQRQQGARAEKHPSERMSCGGSPFSPAVVVTAVHCVEEIDRMRPSDLTVTVGRTNLDNENTGSEITVKEVCFRKTRNGLPRYVFADQT